MLERLQIKGKFMTSNRRTFLASATSAATAATFLSKADCELRAESQAQPNRRPRIVAINSIYRLRSHAYHIAGRFIFGYSHNGFHHQPPFQLVRMFNDQYPADDLSKAVCAKHGIQLCDTVEQTLGGESSLDIDGILLIIEHGEYPMNDRGQILYPRFEMFQRITQVFRRSGRSVPVFVDKHLSYDHVKAIEMVRTANELKFPLMAGSSLPVTWRIPEIEPPLNTPFREGLVVFGYDRSTEEVYFFHALETLQCMMERRRGGETGVSSVTFLEGDEVWKAGDEGKWSWKLLHAAIRRCPSSNYGEVRDQVLRPQAILIEYKDGTRGAVLNLVEAVSEFAFAATLDGQSEPASTCFFLPPPPGANFFNPLTFNIERFFAGDQPYPVERTLLTSIILDLALGARQSKQGSVSKEALAVQYQPPANTGFFRGPFVDGA